MVAFAQSGGEVRSSVTGRVLYAASPKQLAYHNSPAIYPLFGGSKGCGKSICLRWDHYLPSLAMHAGGGRMHSLILRRKLVDLQRSHLRFVPEEAQAIGAQWKPSDVGAGVLYIPNERTPNHSLIEFGHCQHETDVDQYLSAQYDRQCVAAETLIAMADGTYRRIDDVRAGELVETLEGPRAVQRVWPVGRRPSVRIEMDDACVIASERHGLLTAAGVWASPLALKPTEFRDASRSSSAIAGRHPVLGLRASWSSAGPDTGLRYVARAQSAVALLESDASGADAGSDCAGSGDSRREDWPPPAWSARLARHAPLARQAARDIAAGVPLGARGHGCGSNGARDSRAGYPNESGSDDGQAHVSRAGDRARTPSPADAARDIQSVYSAGDHARTRVRSDAAPRPTYFHPYTREARRARVGVLPGLAEIVPVGARDLWDMQVEEVNHYISYGGIIHQNSFDELVTFSENQYLTISSCCRTTVPGLVPRVGGATNPGGKSARWVKRRWIDKDLTDEDDETYDPNDYMYIPALPTDNPFLNWAQYMRQLNRLPPELRRAYRDGDWDIFIGQFFPEFRRTARPNKDGVLQPPHLVEFPQAPKEWPRYCGLDWGYQSEGVCVWVVHHPDGFLDVEDEYVFNGERRDKLIAREVAQEIVRRTAARGIKVRRTYADPSMGEQRGHESAETYLTTFKKHGVPCEPADNDRVNGWARIRAWLRNRPDGQPFLRIHPRCTYLARTFGEVVMDEQEHEDLDSDGPDHALDALRYVIAARPQAPGAAVSVDYPAGSAGDLKRQLMAAGRGARVLGSANVRRRR